VLTRSSPLVTVACASRRRFSKWPTIPQCYIEGEFIGGCDIMIEMYQNGELQEMAERAAAEA